MIATSRLVAARKTCHLSGSGHLFLSCLSRGASISITFTFPSRSGTQTCWSRRSVNWLLPLLSSGEVREAALQYPSFLRGVTA